MYIWEVIKLYVTDSLIDFLNASMLLSDSTIILTDLDKVIFVASNENTSYLNKNLSDSLKKLLNLYIFDCSYVDYLNTSMDTIIPITEEEDVSKYKSQIVLPILRNGIVERFVSFYY